jgi:hypothetical protein
MQIERRSAGWYLGVDGGTDGGDIVADDCRGPFSVCPELVYRNESLTTGASGELLLTVKQTYRAGGQLLTVREQFWLSRTDGRRVRLLEIFDADGGPEQQTRIGEADDDARQTAQTLWKGSPRYRWRPQPRSGVRASPRQSGRRTGAVRRYGQLPGPGWILTPRTIALGRSRPEVRARLEANGCLLEKAGIAGPLEGFEMTRGYRPPHREPLRAASSRSLCPSARRAA